jgi:hypothetical protein
MHTSVTKARMVVPEMQAEIGAMTYSTTILADSSTDDCQRFKEHYQGNQSTALRLFQQPSLLSLMSLFFNSRYSANCHSLQGVRALFQRGLLVLGFVCLLGLGTADAFPPAPYYTLYGMVRDQVGQTVTAKGAEIILLKGGVEVGRTPITSSQLDQSYELKIRIDQSRTGTTFYTDKAVAALGLFSLVVSMNGELFYPIEVSGNLTAGKGGERVRLDLTLGEDTDKDGLPDVWEQWQLYQAGVENYMDLTLIDKNGDFDKDGQSNWMEYLAGTFAGDATERFGLSIKEKLPDSVRFEFFAITGKVYTIESSLDMQTWTKVAFGVGAPAAGSTAYQAKDVGILSAFSAPRSDTKEFYRLTVR